MQYPPFSEIIWNQLSADRPRPRLVYLAFGPESAGAADRLEELGLVAGWNDFDRAYRRLNDELPDNIRLLDDPNSSPAAEYDAVTLVALSAERASRCSAEPATDFCHRMSEIPGGRPGSSLTRTQVYAALRLTTGATRYEGLTGVVDFGSSLNTAAIEGADPRDKLLVLHEVTANQKNGRIIVGYLCSAAGAASGRPAPTDASACSR